MTTSKRSVFLVFALLVIFGLPSCRLILYGGSLFLETYNSMTKHYVYGFLIGVASTLFWLGVIGFIALWIIDKRIPTINPKKEKE